MKRKVLLLISALLGLIFWDWISLAYHALGYPRTGSGQASNVAVSQGIAYVSLGEAGFAVIDPISAQRLATIPPPEGSESVDDLASAEGLLFVLDASEPGHLAVFSLADPTRPKLSAAPVAVEVGPFSGVSAAQGKVIVSGGTSRLSLRHYDGEGHLAANPIFADFGRGQPDILIRPDGKSAVVSSHFFGPHFGVTALNLGEGSLKGAGSLEIEGAGFSAGGATPANFPIEGAWAGDALLLAYGKGLGFLDLNSKEGPRLSHLLDLGFAPVNVDVQGTLAAVVGSSPRPQLILIDLRSLEDPKILRRIELPPAAVPTGVAIAGTRVVVAAQDQGVLIFNSQP